MEKQQIDQLLAAGGFRKLIETHVSWVLIGEEQVYKIKKPVLFSFLDFSTVAQRKLYCEKEVLLNQRFAPEIYLDVKPIKLYKGLPVIDSDEGELIDHAVRMKKLDSDRQMDILLQQDQVTPGMVRALARKVADFHKQAVPVRQGAPEAIQQKFRDLSLEIPYLIKVLGPEAALWINRSIVVSDRFMQQHRRLWVMRRRAGLFRDCHGDLHVENIFLLPEPCVFDCIEFNDAFRQIDVLNEVAFICMDLEAFGREDLAQVFFSQYQQCFPVVRDREEQRLFSWYKAYRANVRAKVCTLQAMQGRLSYLEKVKQYLRLMVHYCDELVALQNNPGIT